MYFTYGWPRMYSAVPEGSQDASIKSADGNPTSSVAALQMDNEFLIVVTSKGAQIWAGGKSRVKLGELVRDEASLSECGYNITGVWSSSRRQLAVLTAHGYLLLYGTRALRSSVLHVDGASARSLPADFMGVGIHLQICIPIENTTHVCPEMVADSRTILIGTSDGVVHAYTWHGKLRGTLAPLPTSITAAHHGLLPSTASAPVTFATSHSVGPRTSSSGPLHVGAALPPIPTSPTSSGAAMWQHPQHRGHVMSSVFSTPLPNGQAQQVAHAQQGPHAGEDGLCVVSMDYAASAKQLAIVLRDGRVGLCRVADEGLHPLDLWGFDHWLCLPGTGACCVRLSAPAQLAAVGMHDGTVHLHSLVRPLGAGRGVGGGCLRVLSLLDWGHGESVTGRVGVLRWSPDGRALAVGHAKAGLVVWSPSGCRLLCSLRQARVPTHGSIGGGVPHSPRRGGGLPGPPMPLEGAVMCMTWSHLGYQLLLCESLNAHQLVELTFAKTLATGHRVLHGESSAHDQPYSAQDAVHVLQADDRLLLISESPSPAGDTSGMAVQHLLVPQHYLSTNYPIAHAALSADGSDIAVAGKHGLALYSRRSGRWRVFGDVSQERDLHVQALLWLPRIIVAVAQIVSTTDPNAAAHLLLYPRFHLDTSSILASHPLPAPPVAIDAAGHYILIACAPLDLTLLHVHVEGHLTPATQPRATLTIARELSILSVGQPLRDLALVAPQPGDDVEPRRCVLLRAGGVCSILDLVQGSEVVLTMDVECFWLPAAPVWRYGQPGSHTLVNSKSALRVTRSMHVTSDDTTLANGRDTPDLTTMQNNNNDSNTTHDVGEDLPHNAYPPALRVNVGGGRGNDRSASGGGVGHADGHVEMPWWTYGPKGMQLWFPSTLLGAATPTPSHTPLSTPHFLGGSSAAAAGATHSPSATQDPELEFDKEVYPIGISFAEVAIVGITQRTVRSAAAADVYGGGGVGEGSVSGGGSLHNMPTGGGDGGGGVTSSSTAAATHRTSEYVQPTTTSSPQEHVPCFHPLPESQPVLPCMLRRLLQQNKFQEALTLARTHAYAPHFARSMEWLLFTTLEMDAERFMQAMAKQKRLGKRLSLQTDKVPLVTAAARLLKHFPRHFPDITVRVARKTDSVLWPVLFEAVGPPRGVLEALETAGALQSAACCLIIVDQIQGPDVAHAATLRLIRAALAVGSFALVAELVRFLLPPGDADAILAHVHAEGVAAARAALAAGAGGVQEEDVQAKQEQQQQQGLSSWWSWLWPDSAGSDGATQAPSTTTPTSLPTLKTTLGMLSPRSSLSTHVVQQAWSMIGQHAWWLLQQGRLRELADLGTAFAHMGGGVESLLLTTAECGAQPPTAMSIVSALAGADNEFGDPALREAALTVMQVLQGVRAQMAVSGVSVWLAAVAVVIQDMNTLAAIRDADRELWNQFATAVIEDAQFEAHAHVVRLIHLDGLVEGRLSAGAMRFAAGGEKT